MTRPRPCRDGFTLIEVMVATVISAFVVTAVLAAVTFTSEAHTRRMNAAAPQLGEHATRAALEGWMRAASVTVAPFVGTDRRYGALELDELHLGLVDGGVFHPGPARLRLWTDPGGGGVQAEILSIGGVGGATRLTLAPGAAGLSLRYRTRIRARHVWVDSWDSDEELPAAIRIQVITDAAAVARQPSLHDLPLVLPVGWEAR
jgi:prepilin-type N-terminal cleavage/methylation domain-containing protein